MRKRGLRLAVVLAAVGIFVGSSLPSASALTVGPLTAQITVDTSGWDATGYVGDSLTNANYTSVLTATGFETTGATNGVILDFDTGSGNPSLTSTGGGFDSQYAKVVYTLTWTSVLGTTGELTKVCVEALNQPICTIS
jgi:hypothetical protein